MIGRFCGTVSETGVVVNELVEEKMRRRCAPLVVVVLAGAGAPPLSPATSDDVRQAIEFGAEGIGLFRTEHMDGS